MTKSDVFEVDANELAAEERMRARRDLHCLAHVLAGRSQSAAEVARSLRTLNPRAAGALPPRELDALAALVAAPHRLR